MPSLELISAFASPAAFFLKGGIIYLKNSTHQQRRMWFKQSMSVFNGSFSGGMMSRD